MKHLPIVAAIAALTASCTSTGAYDHEAFLSISTELEDVKEALESETATPAEVSLAITEAVAAVSAEIEDVKAGAGGIVGAVKQSPIETAMAVILAGLGIWASQKKAAASVVPVAVEKVNAERDKRRKDRGEPT